MGGCCITPGCIINPFRKENLASTVAKGATVAAITTIFAVVIGALVASYPNSTWIILGVTGGVALISFVVTIIALTIRCMQKRNKNDVTSSTRLDNAGEFGTTGSNPFGSHNS